MSVPSSYPLSSRTDPLLGWDPCVRERAEPRHGEVGCPDCLYVWEKASRSQKGKRTQATVRGPGSKQALRASIERLPTSLDRPLIGRVSRSRLETCRFVFASSNPPPSPSAARRQAGYTLRLSAFSMSPSMADRPWPCSPGPSISRTLMPLRPLALPGPELRPGPGGGVTPSSRVGGNDCGGRRPKGPPGIDELEPWGESDARWS